MGMKKIQWYLTIGYPTADRSGEIEVNENATDEEIEEIVCEEANNYIEWGWSKSSDEED
jgi:hypothetical protein